MDAVPEGVPTNAWARGQPEYMGIVPRRESANSQTTLQRY